jgi:hypothetical protein
MFDPTTQRRTPQRPFTHRLAPKEHGKNREEIDKQFYHQSVLPMTLELNFPPLDVLLFFHSTSCEGEG